MSNYTNKLKSRYLSILKMILLLNITTINHIIASSGPDGSAENMQKIQNVQSKILKQNSQLSEIERDIKNIDQQISEKANVLANIDKELNSISVQKRELNKQKTDSMQNLNQQKKYLNQQLKAMYFIHKSNNTQKIANIDNMQQLNRFLTYLDTYNKSSNEKINEIKTSIQKIELLDTNLDLLQKKQNQFKQAIVNSKQELEKLKKSNLTLRNNLQASLQSNLSKVNYYKNQYKELDNVLTQNYNNQSINLNSNFAKTKGKLPLPVSGIIKTTYKDKKAKNTIFIETAEGKDVKAVYGGKVVFSNWLRGFGFLAIIDHNDGYMSLYGNNQTLLKKTGELVEPGETIALTGASGGIESPGLYFEIRHNGNSINAVSWLKGDISKTLA